MIPDFPDMPPRQQDMVTCAIKAATAYEVPVNLLLAIAEKESGRPGQWVRNTNGTYDVGTMQFNTAYLAELKPFGIEAHHVAASGCYPYALAAWRVRHHLKHDQGDVWTRAANYHSRTPAFNARYRYDLRRKAAVWAAWLDHHFPTHDLLPVGASAPRTDVAEAMRPVSSP